MTTPPKIITVIGATGKTGRLVVEQAVAAGYQVRVLVRKPDTYNALEGVTVIAGDAHDPAAIKSLLEGADALISALGHVKGSSPTLFQGAFRTVIETVSGSQFRLVFLTGAGVVQPGDTPKAPDRLATAMLRLIRPQVIKDAEQATAMIQASDIAWTILRAPVMSDQPGTGQYKLGPVGSLPGFVVSRADVAACLVDLVKDRSQVRMAPAIFT